MSTREPFERAEGESWLPLSEEEGRRFREALIAQGYLDAPTPPASDRSAPPAAASGDTNTVENTVNGDVSGKVVQCRDVSGNISL